MTSSNAKPTVGPEREQKDSARNTSTQNSHAHTARTPTTQAPHCYAHTNRLPSRLPPPLTHTRTSLPPPPPPPSQFLPPPNHPSLPVYLLPQVFLSALPPAPPCWSGTGVKVLINSTTHLAIPTAGKDLDTRHNTDQSCMHGKATSHRPRRVSSPRYFCPLSTRDQEDTPMPARRPGQDLQSTYRDPWTPE